MKALTPDNFLSERIYQTVRAILRNGPTNRPRAILQAYQTFLHRWVLIRLQGLEDVIYPDLLALLSLVQYTWPDMFRQISTNQYYFFYLHSLATGRPNSVCSATELDEIHDLGLPAVAQSAWWHNLKHPELYRLFDTIEIDQGFGLDKLALHITLDPRTYLQISEEQPVEALNSGDPARIKSAYLGEALRLGYESQLLNLMTELNEDIKHQAISIKDDRPKEMNSLINRAETIIFALGLVSDSEESVSLFSSILCESPSLPLSLQLRVVYALGHLAQRGNIRAISILIDDILSSKEKDQLHTLRVRVAHLSRYFDLNNQQIATLTSLYAARNEHTRVRQTIKESWIQAYWGHEALEVIAQEKLEELNPSEIIEICDFLIPRSLSWRPSTRSNLGNYLIQVAQKEITGLSEHAFALLSVFGASPEDNVQIIAWLFELLKKRTRFSEKCWQKIGSLQKDKHIPWQADIWKQLQYFALEEDQLMIINALINTQRLEAKSALAELKEEAPPHWVMPIEDGLAMLEYLQ